ncbi:ATP synthase subunit A [Enterocloster clostridioformis]|uniref:V-type ATP synthase subunit A n=1 Tax=Enterocloster clostridioformis TaxID=1531 RepID=UPI00080C7C6B|nr:V-type ATP synthase subunit A [Enterocloster clostridioformis]ANU46992.1 V-type ATP synthase subunit A [Lachnoclostridium sp. YL32]NDO32568.1 V-type ATP synthase subunit A [Enterocloster clostridioformis]OXE62833.1 ATP synthase subunit A [Enterocloster clostridioformis]QQQ98301.1 V-type ATP synthase subunit A [Enterocloster clostridioformis]
MAKTGVIYGINGPVVSLLGDSGFQMNEMVHVGQEKLVGEVIGLNSEKTTIQVYEESSGIKPGETVTGTGAPVSVTLAPGILSNIFDGIERPLSEIAKGSGYYISRGISVNSLDTDKKWDTHMVVKEGDRIMPGTIIAEVPETRAITHKVMAPPDAEGYVLTVVPDGRYTIEEPLLTLQLMDGTERTLTMTQKWPIRVARPSAKRFPAVKPLITGQRILDTMFPLAKGGTAAIPGGFGTGKTMTQHQVAKWSDADVIIYIGCGERGNEMTQVLEEFSELIDPKTGNPLMDRTTLIANTSNMPVAAREASLYSGLTLAEYYRDMGYHVAIMADSTSRWAEALRELSGRLEEMPAEEGFPAYLASRLSAFYERAGMMQNLNGTEGSVTIIGAVSPQGGDFSEPVTMNTKRFVRCFWGLDKSLAYARHFPAIHWLTSYSEYINDLSSWYMDNVDKRFVDDRNRLMALLVQESSLMEIVKLIGADVLPDDQKLVLEIAKVIRLGFLQQNAFHKDDTSVPLIKQFKMMEVILYLYKKSRSLVSMGMPVSVLKEENIFDKIISIKYDVPNDRLDMFDNYMKMIDDFYDRVVERNA